MCSVWNSVLSWVFLCLCSSTATADNSLKIKLPNEQEATHLEGSCVTIQCQYKAQGKIQLIWFKDAKWNDAQKTFIGTIVYSNTEERPQAPEYSDRVEFLNEVNSWYSWSNCSLKINHLNMEDNGNYSFRYISEKPGEKFMSSSFNLRVTENRCKVNIRPPHLNNSLKEGDTVSYHCVTSVECASDPIWDSFDSSEVREDKEDKKKWSELTLTLSSKDDGRTLTCRTSESQLGHCLDKSVTLSVEYSPKETTATKTSNSDDVKEGEGVTISCSSKAKPRANFTWFKGHQIYSSTAGETLTLNNVTPKDAGIYYCQANNEHGPERSNGIIINVIFAPKRVSVSPSPKKLTEGEQLKLTCLVGESKPEVQSQSYKWYKDDKKIDHQITAVFTVQSVKRSDIGRYWCMARNSVGETTSTSVTQVSVMYAPQNTYIEGMREIKLGFRLNLECINQADPSSFNYHWYFKPEHEKQIVMLSHTRQDYVIEKVALVNAGVYKCSAQNDIGTGGNSSEVNVIVLYSPRKPNLTMKKVVKENEFYSITCTVESKPQATITLIRSSLKNPEKETKTLMTVNHFSNILNFTAKASVSDAGTYTCVAVNSEGQNYSNDQLKVWYAPKNVKVTAYPDNELTEGSELKLTCEADSVPEVYDYTWKKTFRTQSLPVGHGQTITLSSLHSSDSDHYFCISRNEMGTAESPEIYIRIKYQPRITVLHNMTSLGLLANAVPVHLSCNVQSDPPVTLFAWYKLEENTSVLSNNQNYTVQAQYPGTYYCTARNEIGKSTSEPVKINLNHVIIKRIVQSIISILLILLLIVVIFLLQRFLLRKRCLGTNEAAQGSFFFSPTPISSNLRSTGSSNSTTENLVMAEYSEISGFRDFSGSAVYSNPSSNRTAKAERSNNDINTTYDLIKLPPSMLTQHHHAKADLPTTTVNYAQFMGSNNPNKSEPNHDGCGPVYASVLKKEQRSKEQQATNEDYENLSGISPKKQPLPNLSWDSDSTESEEEVTYSKVSFTAASQHNPQKERHSSDEEDKTEYSQVKI